MSLLNVSTDGLTESGWLEKALSGAIPVHIGIIMDGNGRWAEKKGLQRKEGHRAGVDSMRKCLPALLELGVKYCTLFAFSTENWKRPKDEVQYLFSLIMEYAKADKNDLLKNGVRVLPVGRWERFPSPVVNALRNLISETSGGENLLVQLAINYGGRQEILDGISKYLKENERLRHREELSEKGFSKYLYSGGVPDPDLIIRTSGEKRLSNFLLWGSAYSELVFTDTLWPDFGPADLYKAVCEYSGRRRRFGDVTRS